MFFSWGWPHAENPTSGFSYGIRFTDLEKTVELNKHSGKRHFQFETKDTGVQQT